MSIFSSLPSWGVGLLALGAGAILLFFNYAWLLAAKSMLDGLRRKNASPSDTPEADRDGPTPTATP